MVDKIWANSGDSHLVEPDDLWEQGLPAELAARMPHSVKDEDGLWETIYVDGGEYRRQMPRPLLDENGVSLSDRAPGANDKTLRLKDLDEEGIWAELIYPSLGVWAASIRDPKLVAAGARVLNDWAIDFQRYSIRYVCGATIPCLNVDDAVAEVGRAADLGFYAANMPVKPVSEGDDWQHPSWDPLWAALEETGLVIAFHVGTEPLDAGARNPGNYYRGPGGAILNYWEVSNSGQRAAVKMIAGGEFDRFPGLRVIVSEGGATWGPFVADRLDEAYRQHAVVVRPKLSRLPSEYLYENVYASFQHDRSAVAVPTAMGWKNVCWGSDYPHTEGTYGHTQKTLHELFDDVDSATRHRITLGAFEELFPHVPPAPTN